MPKFPPSSRPIAAVALLVLVALAGYFWWRQMPARIEDGCSLHERPCSAPIPDGGRVILGIEPRPLGYGQPWRLTVKLEEAAADTVGVDFTGLDVPTSFNRIALEPAKDGGFVGEATLPMCAFEPIDWQVSLLLGAGEKSRTVSFAFNSDPAGKVKSAPRKELASAPGGGTSMLHGADGPFSADQMRGYATVLFFGYTSAPATCPQPLTVIDAALARLSPDERAKVRAVMVALDAEGDAPARLQPKLQARNPNYRVATGAGADLAATSRLYGASYLPRAPGPDGKPRIDHAAIYSLLDPSGRLVGQVAMQDPERLAGELRKLLGAGATKPISPRQ